MATTTSSSTLYSLKSVSLSSFAHTIVTHFPRKSSGGIKRNQNLCIKSQTLDFSVEGSGFGGDDDPPGTGVGLATAVEEKEEPQCPPGLWQYETMAVLRPDMSEDERLTLTQKYEELLVAGVACMYRYSIGVLFHWLTASRRKTRQERPTLTFMGFTSYLLILPNPSLLKFWRKH